MSINCLLSLHQFRNLSDNCYIYSLGVVNLFSLFLSLLLVSLASVTAANSVQAATMQLTHECHRSALHNCALASLSTRGLHSFVLMDVYNSCRGQSTSIQWSVDQLRMLIQCYYIRAIERALIQMHTWYDSVVL